MTTTPRHPSFLELDRAALGPPAPSLARHLETCAECGAYLQRVKQPESVPAWARSLGTAPPRGTWRLEWRRWGLPLVATAALACLVFVVVPGTPYVAPKGAPAVAVHLKRGEQVFLWDGQTPLVPEDRIRLQVSSESYRYVAVAARAPSGWAVLFAGPLSEGPDMALPASWRVDEAGGEEVLRVLFSREPLPTSQTEALFSDAPRTEKLWTTELRLPKGPPP
ncbi:hypothetical protein HUA78_15465 [Myxococcus sp. CA033]|uniref:hypothetical protein n=1 Tax=Myxococcus sp. CA033 TaxID=2741516 RepID=UPI00157AE9B7|nr:hypothetical protein [Myxococcus sp. CA033]NTX35846.1 hypothetical protein [Myxococcus sp. CA033]